MNEVEIWEHRNQADIDRLPRHMREAITEYITTGHPVGDFLMAVLSNDLVHSFSRADEENQAAMFHWASFLYNAAPGQSWGNLETVIAWIAKGGICGKPITQPPPDGG